ncbi:MAG: hypothetical protein PWP06_1296 [Candidatus Marinimicrobia bacterium]|jgi:hypothetical protein|nr:hypothetical protein [Candidatus Neomarinimicrobiota bacterium]
MHDETQKIRDNEYNSFRPLIKSLIRALLFSVGMVFIFYLFLTLK